ncbi:hypothetical protein LY01_01870 [Nonlabens xylanidelens]|uniref:Outer membrane protein with beta-barrel domain n=1 Tax=Nonlabens xylanidelens TaxID=191564 RepID=A0A2S6ILK8_9FLAO|nr:autotransporter domain-containing protein [Nonlabens xylanidelens]PPK95117.1 hypothetical protein LY01_01870 [Nonlabens xylanidelens]PQJ17646.1 hypothetical protein BST94_11410 [Nonlabens xylanidelens]
MKNLLLLTLLMISFLSYSQSTFYSGTLTRKDGSKETVYFKNRDVILNSNGEINIYKEENNKSKIIITANDFTEIHSTDNELVFITSRIKEYSNSNDVILKKLIKGQNSLYVFTDNKQDYFVNEKKSDFELLEKSKTDRKESISYKEWLYKNLNSTNKNPAAFSKVSYDSSSLIKEYLMNDSNAQELKLEPRIDFFNLGVHAGWSSNNLKLDNNTGALTIDDISASNYRLGIKTFFNLDRVSDKITIVLGADYHTSIEGDSNSIFLPESDQQRRDAKTSLELNYISFNIAAQYNLHFNKFSISPYLGFESGSYINDNKFTTVIEDSEINYDQAIFTESPVGLNIGLSFSLFKNFYGFVEYTSMGDIKVTSIYSQSAQESSLLIDGNNDRISFAIGYKIF